MGKEKFIYSLLASHFKFSFEHCPTSEKEKQKITSVPYASVVGSLMYTIVWLQGQVLLMQLG